MSRGTLRALGHRLTTWRRRADRYQAQVRELCAAMARAEGYDADQPGQDMHEAEMADLDADERDRDARQAYDAGPGRDVHLAELDGLDADAGLRLEFRPGGALWVDGHEVGTWLPEEATPWDADADRATDLMADAMVASLTGSPDWNEAETDDIDPPGSWWGGPTEEYPTVEAWVAAHPEGVAPDWTEPTSADHRAQTVEEARATVRGLMAPGDDMGRRLPPAAQASADRIRGMTADERTANIRAAQAQHEREAEAG